ncbi:MAG TPA: DUF4404 family protein [Steroidobacteraceae bacterium]|nr:DUF4404 family protein [Steroidobacteraceae bacterium]
MSGGRVNEKSLRELLARVRERLGHARSVDPDSREHLSAVVSDIDQAIGGGSARVAARTHAPRLESLAVRFEADHPGLAEVIREVIEALARAGI